MSILTGCIDQTFRRLRYGSEWREDEKYGATFHTRLDELSSLRKKADDLGPEEQVRTCQQLAQALATDPSPLYRRQVVRTLAEIPSSAASDGLRRAIQDKDASVRVAACEAWASRGGDEALRVLSWVVGSDADLDVRIAATKGLENFNSPASVQALGLALDDPDPALQHRAIESLKSVTGEDYGNSVPAWRQFVRGGPPPRVDEPSIADRLRDLF